MLYELNESMVNMMKRRDVTEKVALVTQATKQQTICFFNQRVLTLLYDV